MSKKEKPESESKSKWEKVMEASEENGMEEAREAVELDQEELEFPSREKLESQLTAMERQVEEYKERSLRIQAEMDNLRKRTERDISNAIKYGTERLIGDLLPVVDSLVHGLDSPVSTDPRANSMREGMNLTLDLLQKTLVKHGVEIIDPKPGDPFNPALHEAMSIQKIPDAEPDTIAQVMQKGYQLNGRVLRAARVMVAG